ncbi:asparagine synthase (glutamine-hydrolyzing) [Dokdonella sp.]|uniref:asparagine synthase (glutamine-hydrolyzing) n=1 Tax=Dokdonella sp. TaxID=2291710 RepID=UPI002F3EAC70
MCGIIGIVVAPGQQPPDAAVGRAMNDAIRHRGPDDEGYYRDARALLGMRRLAIIDIAGGHQPMSADGGRIQLVFNGEIYNYRELRAELQALGREFHSASDSEVVAQAFAEWGERCFARLDGMFALAVWDRRTQTLVLARDRFGEKPLFYAHDDARLLFASELKALIEVPGFRRELDPAALRSYVRYGYVPTPASIFASVRKLPPGCYLRCADGRIAIERYYALDFGRRQAIAPAEAEERLAGLLDRAVRSRMVADVPFGAFLSGGLDSSTVVALMTRHSSQRVRTYSIGFKEAAYNELTDARRVAAHLGTDHHELVVEPDAVSLLEQLVWYLDEPFADSSAVPTFLVSQLARTQVTMVLTGDAGDETFAGYTRYLRFLALQRLGVLKAPVALAARAGAALVDGSLGYRLRGVAERMRMPFPESYLASVAMSRPETVRALLGPAASRGYEDPLHALARAGSARHSLLDRIVELDFGSYLPDDILVKVDRMAMANSLEGRVPFLDPAVVEFAVSLPDALRVRRGRGKHLLRRVAERWLPADVLAKPKQGFAIPLGQWFRGPLRSLAEDVLASRAFRERGLIDPAAARACLDDHLAGRADRGESLWLILSLELWARRFLDRTGA